MLDAICMRHDELQPLNVPCKPFSASSIFCVYLGILGWTGLLLEARDSSLARGVCLGPRSSRPLLGLRRFKLICDSIPSLPRRHALVVPISPRGGGPMLEYIGPQYLIWACHLPPSPVTSSRIFVAGSTRRQSGSKFCGKMDLFKPGIFHLKISSDSMQKAVRTSRSRRCRCLLATLVTRFTSSESFRMAALAD